VVWVTSDRVFIPCAVQVPPAVRGSRQPLRVGAVRASVPGDLHPLLGQGGPRLRLVRAPPVAAAPGLPPPRHGRRGPGEEGPLACPTLRSARGLIRLSCPVLSCLVPQPQVLRPHSYMLKGIQDKYAPPNSDRAAAWKMLGPAPEAMLSEWIGRHLSSGPRGRKGAQ
jgi:hypothetical protein